MKRILKCVGVVTLVIAGALCTGCTKSKGKEEKEELHLETYDGYAYSSPDTKTKYTLHTKDGFTLHCSFFSGEEEQIYSLQVVDARSLSNNKSLDTNIKVMKVTDTNGTEITDSFKKFMFTFQPEQVLMQVERDEDTLAGSASNNLVSGEYVLSKEIVNSSEEPQITDTFTFKPYQIRELIAVSRWYYKQNNAYVPTEAEWKDNEDGTFTIQLYDNIQDDESTVHTATSAIYTVDRYGKGKEEVMFEEVEFPEVSFSKLISCMEKPVQLIYTTNTETHREWDIQNQEILQACFQALQSIEIKEKSDVRTADAEEILTFRFADDTEWALTFENGNLLRNASCYTTEGYAKVRKILQDYLKEEGLWD